MHADAATAAVMERYRRFADGEAPGRSEVYRAWAEAVARRADVTAVFVGIPETRRQPPLVFAVTRMLGAPTDTDDWSAWVIDHAHDLVSEVSRRSLQTNEPLRCAALLPALSTVDGPIALLEIGASAGLCLYPDRYSYRYDEGPSLDPPGGVSPVVLTSRMRGAPRTRLPDVVWRAGIDLAPLDARDAADRRFLTALPWPGETGRVERIAAALDVAAADPPTLVRGDATRPGVIAALAEQAPAGVTLVITTPGVFPHIPRAGREALRGALAEIDAVWITIDPPTLPDAWHPPLDGDAWRGFVLAIDGRPVADVDPLGASVEWRAGQSPTRG
ncbi:DUF2332 family protein [Microbacterium koreense]|uniref:DUF2332 family protein n=1 Tax=Microbacterium koreense TaxID=323761 RepID=A0ABW2ZQS1_9MICO